MTATVGSTWPNRTFAATSNPFTMTTTITATDASTVGGVGIGSGRATTWDDLAITATFSDDGTIVGRDGDHYVSSGVTWTAGASYPMRFVIDPASHTYSAYVRPPSSTQETRIGDTLHLRTTQQSIPALDTVAAPVGIGSVQVCGATVTWPGDLRVDDGLSITPGHPSIAAFTVRNDGGSPVSVGMLVAGNRDEADANVDFPPTQPSVLAPGASHSYSASRELPTGRYSAWPAWLDGETWRELGPHQTYSVP
jgi:hypothetical protein